MDSIGAQLWLLGYDVHRGGPRGGRHVGYAVAAGLLAELVLRGRLRGAERCELVSAGSTGSAAADQMLSRVAAAPSRSWEEWIREYARTAVLQVAVELEDRCRLVRYERRFARFLAVRRHALLDPAGVDRLRLAVSEALRGDAVAVEPRLGVVASLAATARILTVPDAGGVAVADRLAVLGAPVCCMRRSLAAAVRPLALDVSAVRLPLLM